MDCQQQVEASNNIIAFPPVTIHVMVVDDDATSLAVLSNLLKTLNYQGKEIYIYVLGLKFPLLVLSFVFLF